jgi:hypothetical protein
MTIHIADICMTRHSETCEFADELTSSSKENLSAKNTIEKGKTKTLNL